MTEVSEAAVAVDDESEGPDRRKLALFGGVGVIVLALLAWMLLGQGGSDDDLLINPVAKKPAAAVPAAAPKPVATLPPQSTATLGRDPFKALIVEAVAPAAPVTGPVTGPVAGTPGTGTSTGGKTTTGTKAPQPATYALRLSRVEGTGSNLIARFLVGNPATVQYAKVGSRFGRTAEIKLLSLQSDGNGKGTAVIQVGETPFDISTGDPAIYVQ